MASRRQTSTEHRRKTDTPKTHSSHGRNHTPLNKRSFSQLYSGSCRRPTSHHRHGNHTPPKTLPPGTNLRPPGRPAGHIPHGHTYPNTRLPTINHYSERVKPQEGEGLGEGLRYMGQTDCDDSASTPPLPPGPLPFHMRGRGGPMYSEAQSRPLPHVPDEIRRDSVWHEPTGAARVFPVSGGRKQMSGNNRR
ncbi:hypothetical protein DPEC_G00123760 [Dallia pectoralis]|uniref:Uncharacterized protein n=1 Tax=Dallia pectoralis TaxID=75939 RepID=A0ACC2GQN5_DALPE|nr:hypothetical protein DPEC_G00123760 [Dallia pectoralis]